MYFDSISQIPDIAVHGGFSIFVGRFNYGIVPFPVKNTIFLRPEKEAGHTTEAITVEAVRNFLSFTNVKAETAKFFVVLGAEMLNLNAQNAILKNLEEPKENYHFVFLTEKPEMLLPTIRSRGAEFVLRETNALEKTPEVSEKIMTLAKKLLVIAERDLPAFSKEIADKKDRDLAVKVVATTVELAYKSYFRTGNVVFLKKIPKLLLLYENLVNNGHIRLHFVADMV